VNSFAALIPQAAPSASASTSQRARTPQPPGAKALKKQWNQQICAPTGNTAHAGGRIRVREWSRTQIYAYPKLIDDLPAGSRVLNATGVQENNFPLAGKATRIA